MNFKRTLSTLIAVVVCILMAQAQISPGELSKAHAGLEGVSNCTKCHVVGNKVTREKCLACHKDIQANIVAKKGYHASAEVTGKQCVVCHNEHHGRNFQLVRLDKKTFVHAKTGFELKGAHAKLDCNECHKPAFIKDTRLKAKSGTFLGLNSQCLNCHEDFHKGKMSSNCTNCHNFDSFKNAKGFDHNTTNFPLLGMHKSVQCDKCHKTQMVNGKPVQQFKGLAFANCNACHKDPHENRFGQNCKSCHSESSFHNIKGSGNFDHDKTAFKLVGKHKLVACKSCHKVSLTAPLKHDRCVDCHSDYHKGEFAVNGVVPDCNKCHSIYGFTPSNFTLEKHNQTKFPLEGAHAATACSECHKPVNRWTFRNIGTKCSDCHGNPHEGFIPNRFLTNDNCTSCHNVKSWSKVTFDHSQTKFKLQGKHALIACAECHYPKNEKGVKVQKFRGVSSDCSSCHADHHQGQFEVNGKTDCSRCHGFDNWKNSKFDHNTARFKLDGAHQSVRCGECHKETKTEKGTYILYRNNKLECSNCHT